MNNDKLTFETNSLYYYAEKYRKAITEEEEVQKIDMTNMLEAELEEMIKNGEIIIMNINAKMRLGKSTLAMAYAIMIFKLLKKYGHRKKHDRFTIKNIARDHQEHSKLMRDPNTRFTVIVTDESNALENTGENVTAERALDQVFSDVHAGRYVHRVCCSPKETVDPNADILLSVISLNKKRRITHSKLYYRYFEGGIEYTQLLGYVNTYVGDIIGTWEDIVKPVFMKLDRTKQDEELLERYRKTDWYTEYMIKKYEKMELITKEGIFKPRVLEYAEVILATINKAKHLTRMTSLADNNLIYNFVKIEASKRKIPFSMVGLELATREVMGVIGLYKAYYKICKEIDKNKKNITEPKYIDIKSELEVTNITLESDKKAILEAINVQTDEFKRYISILNKYETIKTTQVSNVSK